MTRTPTPTLRLVGRPAPTVTIERHHVVGAAMNAKALVDDLRAVLNAIELRTFQGSPAGVINEIGRGMHRLEELEAAFLDLAGIADRTPSDPANAARTAA